jgi:hypothetical protein
VELDGVAELDGAAEPPLLELRANWLGLASLRGCWAAAG